ncbi:MAG: hypothetical protein ACI4J6_08125 [Oscillospiraceae bacterium]
MCIIEKQQLWYDNILSYRTRVEETALPGLIKFAEINLDAMDLKMTGNIIFSVNERIEEQDCTILGIELLIPVDKRFKSSSRYVFKPKFRLENAVMCKFSGKSDRLKETGRMLCEYAAEKDLRVITDVYCLVKSVSDDDLVVDMYVGTSGNSL